MNNASNLKNLAVWVEKPYQRDELFNPAGVLNRDNCLSAYRLLKKRLEEKGLACHTQDVYKAAGTAPDAVLFLDIPYIPIDLLLGGRRGAVKCFAVLQEHELIRPGNWNLKNHRQFDALFTWNDRLVDSRRYFKFNLPNAFPEAPCPPLIHKEKLCVMITANKKRSHSLELYSSREETVRWFERNHPEDFDLYGAGWNSYVFDGPWPTRALNRIRPLTRLLAPAYPSYRGVVAAKRPIMEKYKFSICYENARDVPGYITEKIFDSFFAGCVPIYWGEPEVGKYIPEKCFIDRRKFKTHEELYAFIKGMGDAEYLGVLDAIRAFLASPAAFAFSDHAFADTLCGVIISAQFDKPEEKTR
jgi:hypothetical protein